MKLLQTLKDKLPKKLFTKKALIIAVVVIAIGGFAAFKLLGKKDMPVFIPETRTTVLNKTSLVNSISVNGTVKSIDVVNITTTLPYKVTEILVQVGDRVKKGDVIAKLDTTEIQKSIDEERKKISESRGTDQDLLNKAIDKRDESENAVAKAENECARTKKVVDTAYAPYIVARNSITASQQAYDRAFADQQAKGVAMNNAYANVLSYGIAPGYIAAAITNAQTEITNASAAVTAAETDVANAQSAYTAAQSAYENETDPAAKETKKLAMDAAKIALDIASAAKSAADARLASANSALATANAAKSAHDAYTPLETAYNDAKTVTDAAKLVLDNAKAASNFDALAAAYKAADTADELARVGLETAKKLRDADLEAYRTAQKTFDKASTSTTLEDNIKKLAECTIKAETNGVITAINAVVGSAMGQSANAGTGPLAVIQDTDNLIISTSFKEYDIPNIAIGQKVTIKSDATGDEVITGHVSQISMTASSGQSGEVSFPAEIRIETSGTGLLVGMNAKANVILSQKDNIFVVPDDAIGMNEKGEKVVYLQNGENYDPIVVTTGVSNDFYTEIISSQLTEGAVIRSNASEAGSMMMDGGMSGGSVSMSGGGMSGGAIMIG